MFTVCQRSSLCRIKNSVLSSCSPTDLPLLLALSGRAVVLLLQFSNYGAIRSIWVARKPPGFAFVEFEDPRDADDCVRQADGTCQDLQESSSAS